MSFSEDIGDRIRKALAHLPNVEEKKMFGSLGFMVNGKLCLSAGPGRMMCRIDPANHQTAIQKEGCQTVIIRGREYKGYIYVEEEQLQGETDLSYWVGLALEFNERIN